MKEVGYPYGTDAKPEDIIEQYGTWAVTNFGLECLVFFYEIPECRLRESDLLRHIGGKDWVIKSDFEAALEAARRYHERIVR